MKTNPALFGVVLSIALIGTKTKGAGRPGNGRSERERMCTHVLRNRFPHDANARVPLVLGSRCCRVTHESRFTPGRYTCTALNWHSGFVLVHFSSDGHRAIGRV